MYSSRLFMLALVLLWSLSSRALEPFDTRENELMLATAGDEAWLERRAGKWGAGDAASRLLYSTREASGRWRKPELFAPVMSGGDGGDPFYHEATQTLYFTSTREVAGQTVGQANIWRLRRVDGRWGAPEILPAPVNSLGVEYSPVVAGEHLYFASSRDGQGDLYRAFETELGWRVQALGPALNSPTGEWNLWVSDDENLIVFEASGRSTNISVPGDLYGSIKDQAGDWLPAVALSDINGPGSELNPRLLGQQLVYASSSEHGDQTDLYRVPLSDVVSSVERAWALSLHAVARSSHWVREFDLYSAQHVEQRAIGPGPHLLAHRAGRLAAAAYGQYPKPHDAPVQQMPGWVADDGGALLVFGDTEQRITLPCLRPHGSAFDADARRLWVSCEDKQQVVEIDLARWSDAPRALPTGQAGAHVLAWDEPRQQLLVAHTAAGGVAFIQPGEGAPEFLPLASGAEALYVDTSRGELWVTLGPSGELSVVDLETRAEITRLTPGCDFPIDFALGHAGRLWVACFGSAELIALDRERRTVVDRLSLPAGPLNIETHPGLPVLYASLPRQNRVVEISVTGRGISRSFAAGIEPDGLAVIPLSLPGCGDKENRQEGFDDRVC